jgi:ABC-type branched-subunit amino acid transport system ATPase component
MEDSKNKPKIDKSQAENPIVYVIAGPNGAGKTTFATEFLPDFANCREPKRVAYEKEGILQTFDIPLFEKIERSAKEKSNERYIRERCPHG